MVRGKAACPIPNGGFSPLPSAVLQGNANGSLVWHSPQAFQDSQDLQLPACRSTAARSKSVAGHGLPSIWKR